MDEENLKAMKMVIKWIGLSLIFLVFVIWGFSAAGKRYDVWAEGKVGEAEVARAEYNRQIKTLEAKAASESAKFLAEAEITRAKGIAQANQIIGESLKNNEAYLRYLWIDSLKNTEDKVIYVPTEAGLPILEAGKR